MMQKTFTKQFMAENKGCYELDQLNACSFMKLEQITLDSILDSEIPLKDKYWFVCKKLLTVKQNQELSIGVAEIVLKIYEGKYPNDDRPRKAIQAAKDYLNKTGISINEVRNATYAAANAAYAAANAANAAAYAAYATYAAANAAYATYATANAAYAAANAANAAAYAAANAAAYGLENALFIYLVTFVNSLQHGKNNLQRSSTQTQWDV